MSADRKAGRKYGIVTFLLFLASIAVLEYLVGSSRQESGNRPKPDDSRTGVQDEPITHETSTSDLLSLSQALSSQSRDKVADSETVQLEASVKSADGPG